MELIKLKKNMQKLKQEVKFCSVIFVCIFRALT